MILSRDKNRIELSPRGQVQGDGLQLAIGQEERTLDQRESLCELPWNEGSAQLFSLGEHPVRLEEALASCFSSVATGLPAQANARASSILIQFGRFHFSLTALLVRLPGRWAGVGSSW